MSLECLWEQMRCDFSQLRMLVLVGDVLALSYRMDARAEFQICYLLFRLEDYCRFFQLVNSIILSKYRSILLCF
jgi:hypothetical protein